VIQDFIESSVFSVKSRPEYGSREAGALKGARILAERRSKVPSPAEGRGWPVAGRGSAPHPPLRGTFCSEDGVVGRNTLQARRLVTVEEGCEPVVGATVR
jgi:hypothetical protein